MLLSLGLEIARDLEPAVQMATSLDWTMSVARAAKWSSNLRQFTRNFRTISGSLEP